MQKKQKNSKHYFFIKFEKTHFEPIFCPSWPENLKTIFFAKTNFNFKTSCYSNFMQKIKKNYAQRPSPAKRTNGQIDKRTEGIS